MACSLSLCNSASAILEKGTRGGGKRKKNKTHAVVNPRKWMGTPGRCARSSGESRGAAGGPLGVGGWVAGRAVRTAGSPRLSLRPPPAQPPGCAPAPPLTAAPGRGRPRQSGTWATGSRREGAPAPRWSSALTSRRLAPPLGCGGPAATAPAPVALAGQETPGCRRRGVGVPRRRRERACGGHLGRGRRASGWGAGLAPGWTGALWSLSRARWRQCQPAEGPLAESGPQARAVTCGLWPPSVLAAF